mmetsp:Transcript_143598/g.459342  ORF Transcript_143598/g.459342 Transcript_143598/m.459342 type:complete len:340 (+) Transcript_143598:487-1506(+)
MDTNVLAKASPVGNFDCVCQPGAELGFAMLQTCISMKLSATKSLVGIRARTCLDQPVVAPTKYSHLPFSACLPCSSPGAMPTYQWTVASVAGYGISFMSYFQSAGASFGLCTTIATVAFTAKASDCTSFATPSRNGATRAATSRSLQSDEAEPEHVRTPLIGQTNSPNCWFGNFSCMAAASEAPGLACFCHQKAIGAFGLRVRGSTEATPRELRTMKPPATASCFTRRAPPHSPSTAPSSVSPKSHTTRSAAPPPSSGPRLTELAMSAPVQAPAPTSDEGAIHLCSSASGNASTLCFPITDCTGFVGLQASSARAGGRPLPPVSFRRAAGKMSMKGLCL